MKAIQPRVFSDPEQQRGWDEFTSQWNDAVAAKLFHSGVTVSAPLTTANRAVCHNLGRVPTILTSLYQNAGGVVYSDTVHPTPRTHIYVKATGTVTATLLIA